MQVEAHTLKYKYKYKYKYKKIEIEILEGISRPGTGVSLSSGGILAAPLPWEWENCWRRTTVGGELLWEEKCRPALEAAPTPTLHPLILPDADTNTNTNTNINTNINANANTNRRNAGAT